MRLTFLGAARTVTGSLTVAEAGGQRVLVDCGLFQGKKELRQRNWEPLSELADVPDLILTHTHLDHIGRVPRLVRQGFRGRIWCTPATRDLAEVLLEDAAHLQMEDAEYLNRKGLSSHHPALPLFDDADVQAALKLFQAVERGVETRLSDVFSFQYQNAGHLLGASSVRLVAREAGRERHVLFSGDLGRFDQVLTQDPDLATGGDVVVMESTYGNRTHSGAPVLDQLAAVLERTFARDGVLLVPAFAVGRAQQMLVLMSELVITGRLRGFPVHLDSPMAIDATRIYAAYPEGSRAMLGQIGGQSAFHGRYVRLHRSRRESEALNDVKGPAVIISSSGMLAGGRILHHCRVRLPHPQNTLLLTGFQAEGTLGRTLQQGARTVRIHKQEVPVQAEIAELQGLSGHADQGELLRWLGEAAPPTRVLLNHGEEAACLALAEHLRRERGLDTHAPAAGETVEIA